MNKITLLVCALLFTLCTNAQLTEEGFEGAWLPSGWNVLNIAGATQTWVQGNGSIAQPAYKGTHCAYLREEAVATGTTEDWLITPQFNVPANGQLHFYSRLGIEGDQKTVYKVMIGTDPNDTGTFTALENWTELALNPQQLVYTEKVVTIPTQYTNQQLYIAFVMMGNDGDRWMIDDVSIATQCEDPANLTATEVNATSANLSWTSNGSPQSWEIEVVPSGTTPTGMGTTYTGSLPYKVTGLSPITAYTYYVRVICTDAKSNWAKGTFTTTQTPFDTSAVEDFEGVENWSFTNGNLVNKWVIGNAVANGGTRSLYISDTNGATNTYDITATATVHAYRDVKIPAGTEQINLSFDWRNYGQVANDYFNVWLVPATYTPRSGVKIVAGTNITAIGSQYYTNTNFTSYSTIINTLAYAGTTGRLVFEWVNNNTLGIQPPAAIDNIAIVPAVCPAPTNLVNTSLTQNSAGISFTSPVTIAPTYDYYYSTSSAAPSSATLPSGNTPQTNHTITGLGTLIKYYYWVRSNCGGNVGVWVGPLIFTTTQVPATMPYSQNFETDNDFILNNGTQINQWAVGNATANGSSKSLYISNTNGTTNTYNITSPSAVHAFRDVLIPNTVDQLLLTFDWKCAGQFQFDSARVWLVPAGFTPTPGTRITEENSGGIALTSYLQLNTAWTTANIIINAQNYSGTVQRLVFEWINNTTLGVQPPAAIDNISVSLVDCPAPYGFVNSEFTATSASFTWQAPVTVAPSAYEYYYSTSATAPVGTSIPLGSTSATAVTLNNLTPLTIYYVWLRSNCGTGTSQWIGPVTITTPQIPEQLNYSDDFESNPEWLFTQSPEIKNAWTIGTATSASPNKSLYISGNNNDYYTNPELTASAIHAYRDITITAGTSEVNVAFNWKAVGSPGLAYLQAWLVPSNYTPTVPNIITTQNSGGVQLGGNFMGNPQWKNFNQTVNVSQYAGKAMKLVFQWYNALPNSTQPAAIDDVAITIVTCRQPVNLSVVATSATSAQLNWINQGTANSWEVFIMPQGTVPNANSTGISVSTTAYTATNLIPGMSYDFYVRALCSDTNKSVWSGPVLVQTPSPCAPPVSVGVNCLSETGGAFNWAHGNTETQWEVALLPKDDPVPLAGTVIDSLEYVATGLLPETNYTFYVRSFCADALGTSSWIRYNFITPNTSITNAVGVCAPPLTRLVYPNVASNATDYGAVACLDFTPNPKWYFIKVGAPASKMTFNILQNTSFNANGIPTGSDLDVDFVAYGPFTSTQQACSQIEMVACPNCPDNTTDATFYPYGNIVDCSFDKTAAEVLTLPNTQAGQVYAVLVTNYSRQKGSIVFLQTSTEGSTDCDVAYAVNLGDDQIVCGEDNATITAQLTAPANSQKAVYQWFIDDEALTPTVIDDQATHQTIAVTKPGKHTYKVVVTIPGAVSTLPITHEVTITLAPPLTIPPDLSVALCGSNGLAQVLPKDLYADILKNFDANLLEVGGIYLSEADTANSTKALDPDVLYTATTAQKLYAVVSYKDAPLCSTVVPFTVVVSDNPTATISYITPLCAGKGNATVTLTGSIGGTYSSTSGLVIDAVTGTIDASASAGGNYTITYTIPATATCPEYKTDTSIEIIAVPVTTLKYPADVYCSNYTEIVNPILNGEAGTFTASPYGLQLNASTGAIDITKSNEGTYVVTNTVLVSGCANALSSATITIVTVPVIAILQGCNGSAYTLEVSFNNDAIYNLDTVNFEWTDANGTNIGLNSATAVVTTAGTYTITIVPKDNNGCGVSQQVIVDDATCNIQRGISPGDANDNNEFDLSEFNVTSLNIFNRYGKEVYHYKGNYTNQWHGQTNGNNELPTGTYFYSFTRSTGERKTGWIYINRQN